MTTSKNVAAQTGAKKTASVQKSNVTSKPVEPTKKDLQKRIAELEQKIKEKPQGFDELKEYFTRKRLLIKRLAQLEYQQKELGGHVKSLGNLAAADEFETKKYSLDISTDSEASYSTKSVLKVNNSVLIAEVLSYLLGCIDKKVEELKKEIAA